MTENLPSKPKSEILLYQTDDGRTRLDVRLEDNTVWLTQKLIAELFQKDVRTINEHIKNIFEENELKPESTIRKFRLVQLEGVRRVERDIDHYNLDVIISVGYREVLNHVGSVSHEDAIEKARMEYEKYRATHLDDAWPVEEQFVKAAEEIKRLREKNP